MSNVLDQDDFVGAGFERLDDTLIEKRPQKIQWGNLYKEMSDTQKIAYLEKFSSTMNQAAATIQDERNKLQKLCAKKEEQLIVKEACVTRNNDMLQAEVTRLNADRQEMLKAIADLNRRLRDGSNS